MWGIWRVMHFRSRWDTSLRKAKWAIQDSYTAIDRSRPNSHHSHPCFLLTLMEMDPESPQWRLSRVGGSEGWDFEGSRNGMQKEPLSIWKSGAGALGSRCLLVALKMLTLMLVSNISSTSLKLSRRRFRGKENYLFDCLFWKVLELPLSSIQAANWYSTSDRKTFQTQNSPPQYLF
jgi:hypothetical protein